MRNAQGQCPDSTRIAVRIPFETASGINQNQCPLSIEIGGRIGQEYAIQAELDTSKYPKGVKVTDEDLRNINLTRDAFHGEWNYSIAPNCST